MTIKIAFGGRGFHPKNVEGGASAKARSTFNNRTDMDQNVVPGADREWEHRSALETRLESIICLIGLSKYFPILTVIYGSLYCYTGCFRAKLLIRRNYDISFLSEIAAK